MTAAPVRVCSYPPRHDYVDRLHGEVATLVRRDEEWPRLPRLWDPGWVRAQASSWDVAHFHFTWEQYEPAMVRAVLRAHRDRGVPIVWTVHDLQNPHRRDIAADEVYLDLLADFADEVVTLTPGAAERVRRRFGRPPLVVAHGPLASVRDMDRARRTGRRRGPRRVLVHGKSLRANLDWQVVVRAAHRHPELQVLLDVHDEPDVRRRVASAAGSGVRVTLHEPRSFDSLCRRLAGVDALVLPYRWGTHSGLAELATDLAVTVVATDVGHIAEQVPIVPVAVTAARVDPVSLAVAFDAVSTDDVPARVAVRRRVEALGRLRSRHGHLYRRVTTRSR